MKSSNTVELLFERSLFWTANEISRPYFFDESVSNIVLWITQWPLKLTVVIHCKTLTSKKVSYCIKYTVHRFYMELTISWNTKLLTAYLKCRWKYLKLFSINCASDGLNLLADKDSFTLVEREREIDLNANRAQFIFKWCHSYWNAPDGSKKLLWFAIAHCKESLM